MSAYLTGTAARVTIPQQSPPRPARPARPPRPRLTVVAPTRTRAPKAPFVLLVGALLVAGLGGLLFLHTALAEDSFRLHDLKVRSGALADREQALEQEVAVAASPQQLAARAAALGMVRSESPAFIRTSDGRVLGVPMAGRKPPAAKKPHAGHAAKTATAAKPGGRAGKTSPATGPTSPSTASGTGR